MNNYVELIALVEGSTEMAFVQNVLYDYLFTKNVFMTPILISKPGQKGGDVKFERVKRDIEHHLKNRQDTYLTTLIDFYGIDTKWPGIDKASKQTTPLMKAIALNEGTMAKVKQLFGKYEPERRFIPYVAIHEFESLLFSDGDILADRLGVSPQEVNKILTQCGEPENVNNSPHTAPSKRLQNLNPRFKKTTTGITIAKEIGITKMRDKCPVFNRWLDSIESLK